MKLIAAILLVFVIAFATVFGASAQAPESIWLTSNVTEFKTGEVVLVYVNANSVTPIQGFTFQMRYDPACLKPVNASSPIQGMTGLGNPQTVGLVDASFASTSPKPANGVLAEVQFETLGGCQTSLTLESAALAIRNAQGFAAELPGIHVGTDAISLIIDSAVGKSQPQAVAGTPLPLDPGGAPSDSNGSSWLTIALLLAVLGTGIFTLIRRMGQTSQITSTPASSFAVLQIRHGSQAGKSFSLTKLPCLIGCDPRNDICINDPAIIKQHVKIYAGANSYYLMDLGGQTFINGRKVVRSSTVLKSGDVIRLGRNTSFVFGY